MKRLTILSATLLVSGIAAQADTLTMTAGDASGTSSFTDPLTGAAAGWTDGVTPGQAPTAGNDYQTNQVLRTPATAGSYTFAGDSLTILSGGQLAIKTPVSATITVADLILDGGMISESAASGNGTFTYELAGNLTVDTTGIIRVSAPGSSNFHVLNITAGISGSGVIDIDNDANNRGTVQLSAANSFSGTINILNSPRSSTLGSLRLNHFDALKFATVNASDSNATQQSITFGAGSGTYNVGALSGSAASGDITLASGINLSVGARNTSTSFAGYLTGAAGSTFTKVGTGTLTLTGANNLDGDIVVSDGTLLIDGNSDSTNAVISVGDGATLALGASGSIAGVSSISLGTTGTFDVSAKSGYSVSTLVGSGDVLGALTVSAELAIGNSPGTVDFSSDLTLGSASTYTYELVGGESAADLGNIGGDLTIDAGAILDLVQLGTYTVGDKFTLFSYSGAQSGVFDGLADDSVFTAGGGDWLIDYNDTGAGLNGGTYSSFVTVTAIPEPAAALLGGFGLLGLLRRRRG